VAVSAVIAEEPLAGLSTFRGATQASYSEATRDATVHRWLGTSGEIRWDLPGSFPSWASHRRKEHRKQTKKVHDMHGKIKSAHEDIR